MKINNKKQEHNIGTHAERMAKRKLLRRNRVRNTPFRASSKYIPAVEDRKHHEI